MVVVNGKTEVSLSEEEGKRSVSEIVRHPKYRHTGKLYYDAALLILEQPLVVGEDAEVNTICLPPAGVDMGDMQCLVAGWGRDKSKRRKYTYCYFSKVFFFYLCGRFVSKFCLQVKKT